jgi:hypothetical protein
MSEFGKYGVGGKMPIPPYKEEPEGEKLDLSEVGTGTCDRVPDKDVLGIDHAGPEGKPQFNGTFKG